MSSYHHHNLRPQPFQKPVSPSRQRRRARQEAARRAKAEEAVQKETVEETITVKDADKVTVVVDVVADHCCSDMEAFKSKVRQNFISADVDIPKQHFEISGYEKVKDFIDPILFLLLIFRGFLRALPFHTRKYGALHIKYLNLPCSSV